MSRNLFFAIAGLIFFVSSCSHKKVIEPETPPADAPKPPKKPDPPKEPEVTWTCIATNGEGRVFYSTDASRPIAESKSRHECEIYSRKCSILECR